MKGDFSRFTFDRSKHYSAVGTQQGRVQLDADWNEQVALQNYRAELESRYVIGLSGAPHDNAGFELQVDDGVLMLDPGVMFVDGLLCENDRPREPVPVPAGSGVFIAYLEAWKHPVTHVEDPSLREPALGGVDTTMRVQIAWQVTLRPEGSTLQPPTGELTATPAELSRLRNAHYRVEIHRSNSPADSPADSPGTGRFKWSRDNGSVVAAWRALEGNRVTIDPLPGGAVAGFASGQWVELTDELREQRGQPGWLVQLTAVDGPALTVDTDNAIAPDGSTAMPVFDDSLSIPKVRRWDGHDEIRPGAIVLDSAVTVSFSTGTYRSGDYWTFASRTGAQDLPWPSGARPHGVQRHRTPLARVTMNAGIAVAVEDLRNIFRPLTDLRAGPSGPRISRVLVPSSGDSIANGVQVDIADLVENGLRIETVGELEPSRVNRTTCHLTIEQPQGDEQVIGYNLVRIPAELEVSGASVISWTMRPGAAAWWQQFMTSSLQEFPPRDHRLLARIALLESAGLDSAGDGDGQGSSGESSRWFWLVTSVVARPIIEVSPPEVLDFGSRPLGQLPLIREVTIGNADQASAPLTLESVALARPTGAFSLEEAPSLSPLEPGNETVATVAFQPTALGARSNTLEIRSNDPDRPLIEVAVSGTGTEQQVPDIEVSPTSVNFGDIKFNATPVTQELTIRNTGTAELTVEAVELTGNNFGIDSGEGFRLPAPPAPASRVILVTFTATEPGDYNGILVIRSNDPDLDEAIVPIELGGRIVVPEIQVDPSDLVDFTVVLAGETVIRSVEISNTGMARLEDITTTIVDDNDEPIDDANTPFAIKPPLSDAVLDPAPSDPISLKLSFTPMTFGDHAARLEIDHDQPGRDPVRLPLQGRGRPLRLIMDASGYLFFRDDTSLGKVFRNNEDFSVDLVLSVVHRPNSSGFSIPQETVHFEPQSEQTIVVDYQRNGLGEDHGTLRIEYRTSSGRLVFFSGVSLEGTIESSGGGGSGGGGAGDPPPPIKEQ